MDIDKLINIFHSGSGWASIIIIIWVYWNLKNQLTQLELRLTKTIGRLTNEQKKAGSP